MTINTELYKQIVNFCEKNKIHDYFTSKPLICYMNRDAFYNLLSSNYVVSIPIIDFNKQFNNNKNLKKNNKYNNSEEQLTHDQYMTVFWPITRSKNMYLDKFIELIKNILNMNLESVSEEEFNNIKNQYTTYMKNIDKLGESINILLYNRLYQKYKNYKNDFLNKIEIIYKFLVTKNITIDKDVFLNFMLNETPEGRIAYQNQEAIKTLELIEAGKEHYKMVNELLNK